MNERQASQPWALQLEALNDLCRMERGELPWAQLGDISAQSEREKRIMEAFGIGDPLPEDLDEGVRLIHLQGSMMKRPSLESRYFDDARDIDTVAGQLRDAGADSSVRAVILAIDSPGGQVLGTPELAALMRDFPKPNAVFTDSIMASGAYYVGSQALAVYATPSSMIGSIGVYLPILDVSGMMEKFGVKVDLIKSGTHKAAGFPGTQLTEEQRALIQQRVDTIHAEFKAAVIGVRKGVSAADMEGQVFTGREAALKGLTSGVVSGIDEVIARLLPKN